MHNTVFYIIIAIVIFDFIFERVLDWFNSTWRNKPIPAELQGIYDNEKYKKQQEYSKVNSQFGLITSTFSFILMLLMLFFQGFGWLHYQITEHVNNPLHAGLLFFGILFFAMDILSMPFAIYDTFVIEQKFGFNKTTSKIFILDKLKGYLLSIIIGGLIYTVIYKFYELTGTRFWIYTWIIITGFTLFMTLFYSNLIVPLFNKQTPLPEGELKTAINEFASKVGFKIQEIYEIDGSKRSTKANAYFTGLGPKKRIVLYDTLIKELTTDELVAVLAHEIGHYKKKHTVTGLIMSVLQMGIMLYLLSLFISNPQLSSALGVNKPVFYIGLTAFGLLFTPISMLTGFVMNIISRKNEFEADNFAAKNFNAESLVSALKKLASNNLSNLTPHPFYVKINYSHPPLLQRVQNLLNNYYKKM
jgi:STE24 endopeptidase